MMNDLDDPDSISGAFWFVIAAIALLAGLALVAGVLFVVTP